MSQQLVRIYHGMLKYDAPLVCAIFDEAGTLLAQKGTVLTEEQVASLVKFGEIFTTKSELLAALERVQSRPLQKDLDDYAYKLQSPFGRLRALETELAKIEKEGKGERFIQSIKDVVKKIYTICRGAKEGSIAYIFVQHTKNNTIAHAIATSVLVYHVTNALSWKEEEQAVLMAAALTMNIAFGFDLDEKPIVYEKLAAGERTTYEQHPNRSEQMLKTFGVDNSKWLEYVRDHHEHIDGSGFPGQKAQDGISWGAQILSVAEAYCALVLGFGTVASMFPNAAIKHIFQLRGHMPKDMVTQAFLKVLGYYPSGTLVKLVSGEVAVVTKQGKLESRPLVKAIFDKEGNPRSQPTYHNTELPNFAIVDVIPTGAILFNIDYHKLW